MRNAIAATLRPSILAVALAAAPAAPGTDLVELRPLTDRIPMLHFVDGHVVHHERGQSRSVSGSSRAPSTPACRGPHAGSPPGRFPNP